MADKAAPGRPLAFAWPLVLCLVGLDYFSSLAYLPSIAVEAAGPLAPVAVLAVVAVTLLAAVPVYWYVVGRSPHGHGASGLLETLVRGWFGKALILVLLGFIGTDFVLTRTLSTADATTHLVHNPFWKSDVEWVLNNRATVRGWLPEFLHDSFSRYWNEQVLVTVVLAVLGFGFYAAIRGVFTRWFMWFAAAVVGLYLLLTGLILVSGGLHFAHHPEVLRDWWGATVPERLGAPAAEPWSLAKALAVLFVWTFPRMALALSGFELSLASAPLVRGDEGDDSAYPRGRVRNARKLLLAAGCIMSVFVAAAVLNVTLLIPEADATGEGVASHRALAYLAHGGRGDLGPLFGPAFGTLYDLSTVLILLLAGASATIGFRDVAPHYLARFGMQLEWARKAKVVQHLFNGVILVVVIGFHASVASQQWAYATSVLALLCGAAIAATLDLRRRFRGSWLRPLVLAPFLLYSAVFLGTAALTAVRHPSGLAIALGFVAVVFVTAFASRYWRSKELRFDGFTFADEPTRARWDEICQLEFQVLVPHRPGLHSLADKDREIRHKHRVAADVPIIYLEVTLGDPSDFLNAPLMHIDRDDGREVIRVSRCASVAHVLAAIALEFRKVGKPPELIFGWSNENPLAANLHFLLMGEGNVPWMVHELIRHAEPDPARQPRVVIG
jgi:hypothetical protein